MRTRLFLLIAVLLAGAFLLAACAPAEQMLPETEIPAESSQGTASDANDTGGYPPPIAESGDAYPSPDENTEIYIPITGSEDAYPAPESSDSGHHPTLLGTPYPVPEMEAPDMNLKPENFVKFEDATPRPEDKSLTPGNAYVESAEAITAGQLPWDSMRKEADDPKLPGLLLTGFLPTPCNQLRITVSEPDQNGNIQVAAYSLSNPDTMCIQVLEPFAIFIPMDDLPAGAYTITVNDDLMAEMTIPER